MSALHVKDASRAIAAQLADLERVDGRTVREVIIERHDITNLRERTTKSIATVSIRFFEPCRTQQWEGGGETP